MSQIESAMYLRSDQQSLWPKKKKSLVPVGCQLRSWVGREFILFIFSSGSE
jgi:hypothetical protein